MSNDRNQCKQHPDGPHLLHGRPWTHSSQTNVQQTWARFGWSPIHPLPATGAEPAYTYQKKGN